MDIDFARLASSPRDKLTARLIVPRPIARSGASFDATTRERFTAGAKPIAIDGRCAARAADSPGASADRPNPAECPPGEPS